MPATLYSPHSGMVDAVRVLRARGFRARDCCSGDFTSPFVGSTRARRLTRVWRHLRGWKAGSKSTAQGSGQSSASIPPRRGSGARRAGRRRPQFARPSGSHRLHRRRPGASGRASGRRRPSTRPESGRDTPDGRRPGGGARPVGLSSTQREGAWQERAVGELGDEGRRHGHNTHRWSAHRTLSLAAGRSSRRN